MKFRQVSQSKWSKRPLSIVWTDSNAWLMEMVTPLPKISQVNFWTELTKSKRVRIEHSWTIYTNAFFISSLGDSLRLSVTIWIIFSPWLFERVVAWTIRISRNLGWTNLVNRGWGTRTHGSLAMSSWMCRAQWHLELSKFEYSLQWAVSRRSWARQFAKRITTLLTKYVAAIDKVYLWLWPTRFMIASSLRWINPGWKTAPALTESLSLAGALFKVIRCWYSSAIQTASWLTWSTTH
jgi:hypothetical protein